MKCYNFFLVARSALSLRRIQRFMAEYVLDTDLIARLIFKMLPHQKKINKYDIFDILDNWTGWKATAVNGEHTVGLLG